MSHKEGFFSKDIPRSQYRATVDTTIVRHSKYGLCTVGGFDRKNQTLSLHDYRTNKRLTQGAKIKTCRVLTRVAFRSWLVRETLSKGKGKPSTSASNKERLLPPRV